MSHKYTVKRAGRIGYIHELFHSFEPYVDPGEKPEIHGVVYAAHCDGLKKGLIKIGHTGKGLLKRLRKDSTWLPSIPYPYVVYYGPRYKELELYLKSKFKNNRYDCSREYYRVSPKLLYKSIKCWANKHNYYHSLIRFYEIEKFENLLKEIYEDIISGRQLIEVGVPILAGLLTGTTAYSFLFKIHSKVDNLKFKPKFFLDNKSFCELVECYKKNIREHFICYSPSEQEMETVENLGKPPSCVEFDYFGNFDEDVVIQIKLDLFFKRKFNDTESRSWESFLGRCIDQYFCIMLFTQYKFLTEVTELTSEEFVNLMYGPQAVLGYMHGRAREYYSDTIPAPGIQNPYWYDWETQDDMAREVCFMFI